MTTRWKLMIVAFLVLAVTIAHYSTPLHLGPVHDILQRVYYVPVVLAGLWFGMRGGLITAFAITIAYYPHARHGWSGPYSFLFQLSEMVMYHVIGGICGFLASRERQALDAERTARQQREQALDDLRTRTRELFDLEEQLRRADRLAALGTLSAGLAHEIRNPLGSIQTSAEELRELGTRPDDEETPDFLGIILEETERLNRIVTHFLDFARQERRDPQQEEVRCDVNEAVTRTVELLRPHTEQKNIEVKLNLDDENVSAAISQSHLQQVLLNLLLNALEAAGESGKIEIRSTFQKNRVHLTIEDSGPGVTNENVEEIFNPFFTTRERGTGLGLSIVDRIVTTHNGRVYLDQEKQPLNRFVIELPATQ